MTLWTCSLHRKVNIFINLRALLSGQLSMYILWFLSQRAMSSSTNVCFIFWLVPKRKNNKMTKWRMSIISCNFSKKEIIREVKLLQYHLLLKFRSASFQKYLCSFHHRGLWSVLYFPLFWCKLKVGPEKLRTFSTPACYIISKTEFIPTTFLSLSLFSVRKLLSTLEEWMPVWWWWSYHEAIFIKGKQSGTLRKWRRKQRRMFFPSVSNQTWKFLSHFNV